MCGGPKWKREKVADHKFDFVDTREFIDNGFLMRMKYLWLYIIVLKSFLVYVLDIFSATTMLTTKTWSNEIFNQCEEIGGCIFIPFNVGKWLFVGCIIFGFLLLAYESRKAKKIIASRDISYTFTNVMANNYYSLRSYDRFCFFDHISNSTKTSDDFAFFVFFVFKSWKRLLLADGPRQAINALTLYAIYLAKRKNKGEWWDVSKYFVDNSLSTSALTVTTFFTVVVFAGSLLLLIVAGICYIPLLCHIQGNLKEYCCHQVDKRIHTIIKRRQKQRQADAAILAQKEARGDYSHLKNKKGELIAKPLPQPTLPNLSVDDDLDDGSSMYTRVAPSAHDHYYQDKRGDYPPPMPAYNPYSHHQNGSYPQFNPSQGNFGQEDQTHPYPHHYDDDNESTAHLTLAAAPFAHQPTIDRPGSAGPYGHGAAPGYNRGHSPQPRAAPSSGLARPSSGLAYDDDHSNMPPQSNPYGQAPNQYSGYPQQSSQSIPQPRGRGYDEENRGGGYAM